MKCRCTTQRAELGFTWYNSSSCSFSLTLPVPETFYPYPVSLNLYLKERNGGSAILLIPSVADCSLKRLGWWIAVSELLIAVRLSHSHRLNTSKVDRRKAFIRSSLVFFSLYDNEACINCDWKWRTVYGREKRVILKKFYRTKHSDNRVCKKWEPSGGCSPTTLGAEQ